MQGNTINPGGRLSKQLVCATLLLSTLFSPIAIAGPIDADVRFVLYPDAGAVSVAPGQVVEFIMDMENFDDPGSPSDGADATNLNLIINVSGGVEMTPNIPGGDWNCSPQTGGFFCNYTGGAPAGHFNATATTAIRFPVMAGASGFVTISGDSTANEPDPNPSNNSAISADVTIADEASLDVSFLDMQPFPAQEGDIVDVDVRFTNFDDPGVETDGFLDVFNLSAVLDFDQTLAGLADFNDGNWDCILSSPTQYTCAYLNALNVGVETVPLQFSFTAPNIAPGFVAMDVNVSSEHPDPVPGDNFANILLPIDPAAVNASLRPANLSVLPMGPIPPGDTVQYSIQVENFDDPGDPDDFNEASGVHFLFTPSDGSSVFLTGGGGDWSCFDPGFGGEIYQCNLATTLNAGTASPTLVVEYQAPMTPGLFEMDIEVFADQPDANTADNVVTAPIGVNPPVTNASMRINNFTAMPNPANIEQIIDYDVVVENFDDPGDPNDTAFATGVHVKFDIQDATAVFQNGASIDWDCYTITDPVYEVNCDFMGVGSTRAPEGVGAPVGVLPNLQLQIQAPSSPGAFQVDAFVTALESDLNTSDNFATQIVTVGGQPDVRFAGTILNTPDPVEIGQVVSHEFEVENNGAGSTTNMIVDISAMTPGTDVLGASGTGAWDCGPPAPPATGDYMCTWLGVLTPGSFTTSLTVDVEAQSTPGSMDVGFSLIPPEGDDNLADNTETVTTVVVDNTPTQASVALEILEEMPNPVAVGGTVRFQTRVKNFDDAGVANDGADATGIKIFIDAADGQFVQGAGPAWNCGPATRGATGDEWECVYANDVSVDSSTSILNLDYQAPASPTEVEISFETFTTSLDPDPADNTYKTFIDVLNNVASNASLRIDEFTVAPNPVMVGESLDYELVIGNYDNASDPDDGATATNVRAVFNFQGLNQVPTQSGPSWSCQILNGAYRCLYQQPLALNAVTAPLMVSAVAPPGQSQISADVTVISDLNDSQAADNSASLTVPIDDSAEQGVDLQVHKTAANSVVELESQAVFDIAVRNLGDAEATQVVISDVYPNGLDNPSSNSPGWSCDTGNTNVFICVLQHPLPATGMVEFPLQIAFQANELGTFVNAVDAGSNEPDADNGNNTSSASVEVREDVSGVVDLRLSKTATADQVQLGSDIAFDLQVSNHGTAAASGVVVEDMLPEGLINPRSESSNWTCVQSQGQTIQCTLNGLLQPTGTVEYPLQIIAKADQIGQAENTASVGSSNTDQNPGDNMDSAMVEIIPVSAARADVGLQLSVNSDTVIVGEDFAVMARVVNRGPDAVEHFKLEGDWMDAGFMLLNNSGDVQCFQEGQITCTSNTGMNSGEQQDFTLYFSVPTETGQHEFSAEVTSDSAEDLNPDNNTDKISVMVVADMQADLAVVGSVSNANPILKQRFSINAQVSNTGPATATGLVLKATLALRSELREINANDWVCNHDGGRLILCQLDALDPVLGKSAVGPEFVVLGTGVGETLYRLEVTSDNPDPDVSNNKTTLPVNVQREVEANLSVSLDTPNTVLAPGQIFWLSVGVANNGATALSPVLNVDLPTGTEVLSINDGQWACMDNETAVTCTREQSQLGPFGSSIAIQLRAPQEVGSVAFAAEVSSDSPDPDLSNNNATLGVDVVQSEVADLSVSKSIRDDEVEIGEVATFDIVVTNHGPSPANGVFVLDNVPNIFNVQSVDAPNGSCESLDSGDFRCRLLQPLEVGAQWAIVLRMGSQQFDGQIVNTVVVGADTPDPNPLNNRDELQLDVIRPDEATIEQDLDDVLGSSDAVPRALIRTMARRCQRSDIGNPEICRVLVRAAREGRVDDVRRILNALAPDEVTGQSRSVADMAKTQRRNIDSRLQQVRGGKGRGFSMNGLSVRHGEESISLAMLSYLGAEDGESAAPELTTPWGFFINGSISAGERDPTTRELGFEFETLGLTLGVDKRVGETGVVGVALGYADFDSDMQSGGRLDTKGYTLTAYGSFYPKENLYLDGRISYALSDLEQTRPVQFTVDEVSLDAVARGQTDGDQFSAAFALGYHLNNKAWTFTPNAQVRYLKSNIDGYTEEGAGFNNIRFGDQEIVSTEWSLGLMASRTFSVSRGVLSPQFELNYHHESENDGVVIAGEFVGGLGDEGFFIETDDPDRNYGSAGLGLVFVTRNGKQFYINYRTILGLDGTTEYTIDLGGRIEY